MTSHRTILVSLCLSALLWLTNNPISAATPHDRFEFISVYPLNDTADLYPTISYDTICGTTCNTTTTVLPAQDTSDIIDSVQTDSLQIDTLTLSSSTPIMDSSSVDSSVLGDSTTSRPSFFKRFIDYFADANKNKKHKKFDFSIIGGPHYSDNTKLGLGIVAAGLYNIKGDTSIPPSDVSIFGDITTTGSYLLGIRGNNLFPADRFRLNYTLYFYSFPGYMWGVGYDAGINDNNATHFTRKQNQFKVDFLIRLARNTYIGPTASFDLIFGKNFERTDILQGAAERTINGGFGATFVYDSRDVLTNAYRGAYIKLEQKFYPDFASNRYSFSRTEFQADYYHRVWKDCILALDFYSMLNYGDVPWTLMSTLGGGSRMRGYYDGRFRDEKSMTLQAEFRQRVWRRIGVVAWVGAGNVFPSFPKFDWSHTLPNYGIGARWEFKKRVNVRLDYGFGKKGYSAFMFNINEAF